MIDVGDGEAAVSCSPQTARERERAVRSRDQILNFARWRLSAASHGDEFPLSDEAL